MFNCSPAGVFRPRRAFTLVELLVVIAIIGILIGLLLPAIQAAREAARRLECSNHLKQIAMACINHEAAQKFFPSGGWIYYWCGDPNCGYGRKQPGSWPFNILPWLELKPLHDSAVGITGSAKRTTLGNMTKTALNVYYCPTRRQPMLYPQNDRPQNAGGIGTDAIGGQTDYAANAGTANVVISVPGVPSAGDDAVAATFSSWPDVSGMNGICFFTSMVTIKDIRDGTAHTYLIGEKNVRPECYNAVIGDYGNDTAIFAGFDWDWHRWGTARPQQDQRGVYYYQYFGSAHRTTFNISFCDGNVKSINYNIDAVTHGYLCSRSDGHATDALNLQ